MVFTMQWHYYIQELKEHQVLSNILKNVCKLYWLLLLLQILLQSLCFLRILSSGSGTSGATTSEAHVFTMLSWPTARKKPVPAQSAFQWLDIYIKFNQNHSGFLTENKQIDRHDLHLLHSSYAYHGNAYQLKSKHYLTLQCGPD